jgi:hypothetical protein
MTCKCVCLLMVVVSMVVPSLVKADGTGTEPARLPTIDLTKAVTLSIAKLESTVKSPSDYKLIKVELMWTTGKYTWRVTYKPAKLLPQDPSREKIGAGGEIFVDVDLDTEQVEVRHGE